MSLTLAVLSWKSYRTLRNSLDSWAYHALHEIVDQKVIFFQEISDSDKQIAKEYGYDAIGSPNNIGIGAAYKQLVDYTTSDLFLFLENDWILLSDPWEQIRQGMWLLENGGVDVVRFRSRLYPGDPLWTRQFAGNELSRPEHLLDSIHWTDPSKFDQIKGVTLFDGSPLTWYLTPAKYANWTNNPTMFRTEWLRKTVDPFLAGDVEKPIQGWWQEQEYIVAQSEGLFTHMRIDR